MQLPTEHVRLRALRPHRGLPRARRAGPPSSLRRRRRIHRPAQRRLFVPVGPGRGRRRNRGLQGADEAHVGTSPAQQEVGPRGRRPRAVAARRLRRHGTPARRRRLRRRVRLQSRGLRAAGQGRFECTVGQGRLAGVSGGAAAGGAAAVAVHGAGAAGARRIRFLRRVSGRRRALDRRVAGRHGRTLGVFGERGRVAGAAPRAKRLRGGAGQAMARRDRGEAQGASSNLPIRLARLRRIRGHWRERERHALPPRAGCSSIVDFAGRQRGHLRSLPRRKPPPLDRGRNPRMEDGRGDWRAVAGVFAATRRREDENRCGAARVQRHRTGLRRSKRRFLRPLRRAGRFDRRRRRGVRGSPPD
mmetsp:Transcript_23592/g.84192  ORF Transcript_23592/g.84192 Transcript_23592/m.84192 type:complete len:359 (-) Transcript_23592:753-1829(-)